MRKNQKSEVRKNGKPKFKVLENLKPGMNVVYNGHSYLKITNIYKDIAIGCTNGAFNEPLFTLFLIVPTKYPHELVNGKILEAGSYIIGTPNVDITPISAKDPWTNQKNLEEGMKNFKCGEDFLRNRFEVKTLEEWK